MGQIGGYGTVMEHKHPDRVLVRYVMPRVIEFTGDEFRQMTEVSDDEPDSD